ncbi:hypothetical protein BpHYR1_017749 [Brachionus plicatilis]|uniref:Uncharacterized protein n=1 Tax=Brachionus plicatilis TaxID=10195 RepID=A0A3M7S6Z3_BRAPC|nr:hypothetical protein BpHYR1_017749 [Brachionus plicatilis]
MLVFELSGSWMGFFLAKWHDEIGRVCRGQVFGEFGAPRAIFGQGRVGTGFGGVGERSAEQTGLGLLVTVGAGDRGSFATILDIVELFAGLLAEGVVLGPVVGADGLVQVLVVVRADSVRVESVVGEGGGLEGLRVQFAAFFLDDAEDADDTDDDSELFFRLCILFFCWKVVKFGKGNYLLSIFSAIINRFENWKLRWKSNMSLGICENFRLERVFLNNGHLEFKNKKETDVI